MDKTIEFLNHNSINYEKYIKDIISKGHDILALCNLCIASETDNRKTKRIKKIRKILEDALCYLNTLDL